MVAERRAALHCAELLRRSPEPEELLPALGTLGRRLAGALGPALAALVGSDEPQIAVIEPALVYENELAAEIGALAANCLIAAGSPGSTLVASIDGAAVLQLVDRAFGGSGQAPRQLPREFPLSAQLMIERLEGLVVQCLGEALGSRDTDPVRALRHETSFGDLAPFPAAARLALLQLDVIEGTRAPWKLRLALPLATLPKLLRCSDTTGTGSGKSARADPAAAPFADVPLSLKAVLVDMAIPLSAIAALEPGSVLPVSVARAVPILTGTTLVARGAIGTEDDRIAIKLTQLV